MKQFTLTLIVLIAVVGIIGCNPSTGPKTVPAKGTVTIGGQPAPDGVLVTLTPGDSAGSSASGRVKGGAFELFSGTQGKAGAVPGKYKVSLSPPPAGEDAYKSLKPGETPAQPKAPFAKKFGDPATSGIEVEVKSSGSTDLKIEATAE